MKKFLLGACVVLMVSGCDWGSKPVQIAMKAAKVRSITLNGIDSAAAVKMIRHFATYGQNELNPLPASFWFSKNTIKDIVDMLHLEIADQLSFNPSRKDIIDGIRIYFVSDTLVLTGQMKNSIILVSTKRDKPYIGQYSPSGYYHKDYYQHASTINFPPGQLCTGGSRCLGTGIYDPLPATGSNQRCVALPHNITREQARAMVTNFGKNKINTVSEWFDLTLFETLATDKDHNGIRVYFGTHPKKYVAGTQPGGRDAFVLTVTTLDATTGIIKDDLDCTKISKYIANYEKRNPNKVISKDGDPIDNGELCPDNCNTPVIAKTKINK